MKRNIITIDEDLCVGCGICAESCHQAAIGIVDGKAKLLREDFCDGLGRCLPICPAGAISFSQGEVAPDKSVSGCPSSNSKAIVRVSSTEQSATETSGLVDVPTHLNQWPVQIKLVPVNAPYFDDSHLLIAADCAAYAYGNFHYEYMRNRITIIGCPKLDEGCYAEKLTSIIKENKIKTVTLARMEVPCCGGLEDALKSAIEQCGKTIFWRVVTISTDGRIVNEED